MMRTIILAALILLAACGGGDSPGWRITSQADAQGGDSARPASAHLAPLPGPAVTLPAAEIVEACISVRWRVEVTAAGTARLTLRTGLQASPALESSWPMLVELQPPASDLVTTHCAEVALPAGRSALRGEALLVTTGQAPILGRHQAQADWQIGPRP